MIALQRVNTRNAQYYKFIEDLLVDAFPQHERRDPEAQRRLTDSEPRFFNNIIFSDDKPVGFMTYWKFDDFNFLEHFAIHPKCRSKGYGQMVLNYIEEALEGPAVLEVERPGCENSRRRVEFYRRLGFTLWDKDYHQPPYRSTDQPTPMNIMVHGNLDPDKDFDRVRRTIYVNAYGIEPL